ncbi:hypothetical protein RB195_011050 [Necator americanus]|uniref:Uncharacterized protein n=1 Tax=Necator americanus TaxID=51031 RepID=A0ABR1D0W6_NECAM
MGLTSSGCNDGNEAEALAVKKFLAISEADQYKSYKFNKIQGHSNMDNIRRQFYSSTMETNERILLPGKVDSLTTHVRRHDFARSEPPERLRRHQA